MKHSPKERNNYLPMPPDVQEKIMIMMVEQSNQSNRKERSPVGSACSSQASIEDKQQVADDVVVE